MVRRVHWFLWLAACYSGPGASSPGYGLGEQDDDGRSPTSGWDPDPLSGDGDPGDEDDGVPPKEETGGDAWTTGGDAGCVDDGDCVGEGSEPCMAAVGVCELGQCYYEPLAAGTACDDLDACTEDDVCGEDGACTGVAVTCIADHATVQCDPDVGCGGPIDCDDGWADCNEDHLDGCEAELGTDTHCGGCFDACEPGAHATAAACQGGSCLLTCTAPWEDCDDDPSNGCEIPTGTPNQCDEDGLNATTGCWTAHCGNSANPDARNFGSWFCFECTTCNEPVAGTVQWCSHSTGRWFPQETGSCVVDEIDYEDLVCAP